MNKIEDDWALVNRATTDKQAIKMLFERHKDYVYRLAVGFLSDQDLADDTVQSVFLKLQEKKLNLKPEAKFTTWIYQFALNTAREVGRNRGHLFPPFDQQAKHNTEEIKDDIAKDVINFRDLSRALSELPHRQREIFILRYLEGFSTRETAEIVGCKEGTVKVHLSRATNTIEKKLNISNDLIMSSTSTLVT
ncbi:MAG: RNA polymerase sigma factor [Proteobacteria bacterium]|nr:RNA polymerase sigma factor [Pseudomonadota bacterium]